MLSIQEIRFPSSGRATPSELPLSEYDLSTARVDDITKEPSGL